jgi:phosphohistidine phosphatase
MPVLLVRHGDALPERTTDHDRVLSVRGREETRALGRALLDRGLLPKRMVTSPLVRAVQTGEVLASVLGYQAVLECEPALRPSGDPHRSVAMLRDAEELVIAVSHEPIIRVIAAQLIDAPSHPQFRTSGAVLIERGRVVLRLEPPRSA